MKSTIVVSPLMEKSEEPEAIVIYTDSDPNSQQVAIAYDRCPYCGQWAPEFDYCPHCGAPYTPVKP